MFKLRVATYFLLFALMSSGAVYGANPGVNNPPLSSSPSKSPQNPPPKTGTPDSDTSQKGDSNGTGDGGPDCCSVVAEIKIGDQSESFGARHLTIKQLQPSATLVSPSSFNFSSPISTSIISSGTANLPAGIARQVVIQRPDGQKLTYSFKTGSTLATAPDERSAGSALKMIDENTFQRLDGVGNVVTLRAGQSAATFAGAEGRTITPGGSTGINIIKDGGAIKQVSSGGSFANIIPVSASKTQINVFRNKPAGKLGNGAIDDQGATPYGTWTFENPEPNNLNKVSLTQTTGNRSNVTIWQFNPASNSCTFVSGQGHATKAISKVMMLDSTGKKRTINWEYRNAANKLDQAKKVLTQSFSWGESIVSEGFGTGANQIATTHTYNEDASHPETLGTVSSTVFPTGQWNSFTYDSMGRVANATSPVNDAPLGSSSSAVRALTHDYTPVDSDDVSLEFDKRPRKVTESISGQTVSVTYHAYKNDGVGPVEIVENGAASQAQYGDAGNSRTSVAYFGADAPGDIGGELRSITLPSGLQQSFSHVKSDGILTTTIQNGSVANPGGIPFKTTKVVQSKNAAGKILTQDTSVYTGSGYELLENVVNGYDADAHLTSVTKNGIAVYSAIYTDGLLTRYTDVNGSETRYTYDVLDRVETKTQVAVNGEPDVVTIWGYDSLGKVTSETVSSGGLQSSHSWAYDDAGRLSTDTREDGGVTSYTYVDGGRIISETLPGGATMITEQYLDGNVKSITGTAVVPKFYQYGVNSDGTTYSIEYTGSNNSQQWYKVTKDGQKRIVREEYPSSGQTFVKTYAYNPAGQVVKKTETGLADEILAYDEIGQLTCDGFDIDGDGQLSPGSVDRITNYDYGYEKVGSVWFASKKTSVYANDNDATATQTSIVRSQVGTAYSTIVESVDANGNATRVTTQINPSGKQITQTTTVPGSAIAGCRVMVNNILRSEQTVGVAGTTYYYPDALGRIVQKAEPRIGSTSMDYAGGTWRVHSVTPPSGATVTYAYYDANAPQGGRLQSQTDSANGVTYYDYDAQGHVTRTWGNAAYPIEYVYDTVGHMVEQHTFRGGSSWGNSTWPASETADVTKFTYDPATGLLLTRENADHSKTAYTYNARGQIATRTWARSLSNTLITTTYGYDPKTAALLFVDYTDGTPSVSYTYTRTGAAKCVTDALGVRTFAYNGDLSLASESINPEGGGLYHKTIARKYEGAGAGLVPGRSAGFTVGEGTNADYDTSYSYDANGRLGRISGPGLPAYGAVYSYENVTGLLTGIDYLETPEAASVASVQRSYDPVRNAIGQVTNSVDSAMISQYGYARNTIGLITNRTRAGTAFTRGYSDAIAYNDRHEVTGLALYSGTNPAPVHQWGYNYDAIGNRLSTTGDLEGATNSYTPNAVNQYASVNSVALGYDADGNLTNDGAFTYEWDGENRLKSATAVSTADGSQRVEFKYDYMGRRVEKAVYAVSNGAMGSTPSSVERYVYNGWNVVLVLDGRANNAVVRKQTWGRNIGGGGVGGLLAVVNTGSGSPGWLYLYDGFGNVGQVVDRANNAIVARYEYDAYGNTTVSEGSASLDNPYRFSTKAVDNETGLSYYGYRYYSAKLGRWISRDPLGEAGGLNLYGFVGNSPIQQMDALGLCVDNLTNQLLPPDLPSLPPDNVPPWNQPGNEPGGGTKPPGTRPPPRNTGNTGGGGGGGGSSKDYYHNNLPWPAAGALDTVADIARGVLSIRDEISHLGEGTGTFSAAPSWDNAPGMLNDVALTTAILAGVGGLVDAGAAAEATSGAENAMNGLRLQNQLAGQEIAGGHAFVKHAAEFGFTSQAEMAAHVETVMTNSTMTRSLSAGRTAFWDNATGSVVIRNPAAIDGGTTFIPKNGVNYFLNELH